MRRYAQAMIKKILIFFSIFIFVYLGSLYVKAAQHISFYNAHVGCGAYYISKRPLAVIKTQEGHSDPLGIAWLDYILYQLSDFEIQPDQRFVSTFGGISTTVKYYPGFGCSQNLNLSLKASSKTSDASLYFKRKHQAHIQSLIQKEVQQDSGTRALVVFKDQHVIGEYYDAYTSPTTPLLSWSMTKSVIATLYAVLEQKQILKRTSPVFASQLSNLASNQVSNQASNHSSLKNQLTFEHLLTHTDGFDFNEEYIPLSAFFDMLTANDIGHHISQYTMQHTPGTVWRYSSAASNLLAYKLIETVQQKHNTPPSKRVHPGKLLDQLLLSKLKMNDSMISFDPQGSLIGASLGFFSSEDWLKFALMMLNGGQFEQQQIISQDFIQFALSPNQKQGRFYYGAGWWINGISPSGERLKQGLPASLYQADGYQGQSLSIFPEHKLMIVRLGLTRGQTTWKNEIPFLQSILQNAVD